MIQLFASLLSRTLPLPPSQKKPKTLCIAEKWSNYVAQNMFQKYLLFNISDSFSLAIWDIAYFSETEDNFYLSTTNSCVQTKLNLNFKVFLKQRVWVFCSKLILGMALFLTSTVKDQLKPSLGITALHRNIKEVLLPEAGKHWMLSSSFAHILFPLEMLIPLISTFWN